MGAPGGWCENGDGWETVIFHVAVTITARSGVGMICDPSSRMALRVERYERVSSWYTK